MMNPEEEERLAKAIQKVLLLALVAGLVMIVISFFQS